jgi:S1-C subfamily serine protease
MSALADGWRKRLTDGLAALLAAAGLLAGHAAAAETALESRSRALSRATEAVVGIQVTAVEDARSAATLGLHREGSGVVIGADGLVLTIGYLILEAESVDLLTDDGRHLPARVVGYDVATGFGLVQSLVPLRLAPVPLGDASALSADEPLMVASGGEDGTVGAARLASRRAFSGFWEYHVDSALFVAPPHREHGGAGLFNGQGELVGIGSLVVSDALGTDAPRLPGNMFVPVDLLKPILAELREHGSTRGSARPWIGLNCVEQAGTIRVLRVSEDSPADMAGLQPGDRILRIDGTEVARLEQLWKTLWAGSSAEREVTLDIQRDGESLRLTLHSVDRATMFKHAQGI